ncbi:hypothetical protein SAMN05660909_00293 [Chitinophaga terrae (ex Kim and Jung 2007)]|uniref:Uncharacterized protein n=1 Tax=Chitinophaga terrae (ex Kim and Jung 2007) TaxID=408074 RepID=A0A1H3X6M9_9BACT|nr:hypothetical protein SAMN05660909_00293 [Chitinophaga terrae (ex Kim and Jung 2007)]
MKVKILLGFIIISAITSAALATKIRVRGTTIFTRFIGPACTNSSTGVFSTATSFSVPLISFSTVWGLCSYTTRLIKIDLE